MTHKAVLEAIEFYANPDNYEVNDEGFTEIEFDFGWHATAVTLTQQGTPEYKVLSYYYQHLNILERGELARDYLRGELTC